MAEWIEVLFGMETLVGPENIVLDGGPDPPMARGQRGKTLPIVPYINTTVESLILARWCHSMQPSLSHFSHVLLPCVHYRRHCWITEAEVQLLSDNTMLYLVSSTSWLHHLKLSRSVHCSCDLARPVASLVHWEALISTSIVWTQGWCIALSLFTFQLLPFCCFSTWRMAMVSRSVA